MRTEDVIDLVLTMPGARRSAHAESPDFRVAGKIFATLPSKQHLVLKLTVEQQVMVMTSDPGIFSPVEGAWGDRGWTNALISALDYASALAVLSLAWTNVAPKAPFDKTPPDTEANPTGWPV